MHLILIAAAVGVACCIRLCKLRVTGTWFDRWYRTLTLFLFSPLLLLITAIAILCMGTQGQMAGFSVGRLGYFLALGFLGIGAVLLLLRWIQGWRSLRVIRAYPASEENGITRRILNTPTPFAAQIGFWRPELVVSQGLLSILHSDQLEAVLAHEQAHHYYRDTFWFFWLGWLRQLTAWLPNTTALWEELLLLRELRADCWAAQHTDPLLLAESLLLVVKSPLVNSRNHCAAFELMASGDRLSERIEALIAEPQPPQSSKTSAWMWLLLALLPLVTVVFHT